MRASSFSSILRRSGRDLPLRILAGLIAFVVLGPLLWGLSTSLKTEVLAVHLPPEIIPSPLTVRSYLDVFTDQTFLIDLWNSAAYALGGVIVALVVGVPAG